MRYNPLKPSAPARPPKPVKLPKSTIPKPSPVSHVPVLTENEEKDGFELRFPTRPEEAILALFHDTKGLPKEQQWHWHRRGHFWYAKRNDVTRFFAQKILGGKPSVSCALDSAVPAAEQLNAATAPNAEPIPEHPETNIIPVSFAAPVPTWRARMLRQPITTP
jgi:hypothetical protein